MLSISKPQTNLIYLSILVGRLDLTRFSILCKFTLLLYIAFSTKATYLIRAGGSLTYKSMLTHLWALPNGDPAGNRTRVFGVRGRRLNRLTTGPYMDGCAPVQVFRFTRPLGISYQPQL